MKKLVLSLALLLVAVGTVQAQDVYQWFGTSTDVPRPPITTDWNTGYAWKEELTNTFGVVPGANAKVKINNVQWGTNWEQYSPVVSANVSVGDIFVAEAGAALSPEYLVVAAGGTLNVVGAGGTASGQINLGYQAGAVAALNINGGTAIVAGPVHVGWGGDGTVTINGGSLTARAIDIAGDPIATGSGRIAVNGGELRIAGYHVDEFQQWVDDGLLTSNGSADGVVITYDELTDYTVVTPEPVSIALMGLGALLLRRRS